MNEMTDEQINQAVAECQGWKRQKPKRVPYMWAPGHIGEAEATWVDPEGRDQVHIPKFTESRDAMAGALEKLSEEEWRRFIDLLWVEIGSPALKKADNLNDIVGDLFVMFKALLLATPLQACRAFLKAKGKL